MFEQKDLHISKILRFFSRFIFLQLALPPWGSHDFHPRHATSTSPSSHRKTRGFWKRTRRRNPDEQIFNAEHMEELRRKNGSESTESTCIDESWWVWCLYRGRGSTKGCVFYLKKSRVFLDGWGCFFFFGRLAFCRSHKGIQRCLCSLVALWSILNVELQVPEKNQWNRKKQNIWKNEKAPAVFVLSKWTTLKR